MTKYYWLAALLMLTLSSCSQGGKRYTIGVSQCSEDIWREKQNAELRMGAYFHDNVELKFAAAYDSDERQVQQIDSLMNEGIDLLIVAPNQVNTISPAIDRAYDKGIPVIVFERKTDSQKYTAFISADNYEMGHVMGEYIVSRLHGKGNVLEIKGLAGSSPAIERHNGFMDAIKDEPGIKVVGSLQGDWTEETACQISKQWLAANEGVPVDLVFGANDRTAMGAREALGEKPLYCGIDGLPGKNGGIQLVRDSLLDASFIYPTHGDQLMDLAIRILEGQPYEKETMLMSALVTHDNAKVLLMQSEEMMKQASQLDQLHEMADGYLEELGAQRLVNWLALGFIFLLVGLFVLFYLYHLRKIALQRERVMRTLWNMQPDSISVGHEQNEESAAAALLVVTFSIVRWPFFSSVGSGSSPGTTGTSGSSGSGLVPFAVATFSTSPASTSSSVTVYFVSNSSLAFGARLLIVHLSPVRSSVTSMSVIVRLPSFRTVIL